MIGYMSSLAFFLAAFGVVAGVGLAFAGLAYWRDRPHDAVWISNRYHEREMRE